MIDFLSDLPKNIKHNVLRTLRGQVLRTELYRLDNDIDKQDRPYSVSENLYGILPLPIGELLDGQNPLLIVMVILLIVKNIHHMEKQYSEVSLKRDTGLLEKNVMRRLDSIITSRGTMYLGWQGG
jgi:hypothetical protein